MYVVKCILIVLHVPVHDVDIFDFTDCFIQIELQY